MVRAWAPRHHLSVAGFICPFTDGATLILAAATINNAKRKVLFLK